MVKKLCLYHNIWPSSSCSKWPTGKNTKRRKWRFTEKSTIIQTNSLATIGLLQATIMKFGTYNHLSVRAGQLHLRVHGYYYLQGNSKHQQLFQPFLITTKLNAHVNQIRFWACAHARIRVHDLAGLTQQPNGSRSLVARRGMLMSVG